MNLVDKMDDSGMGGCIEVVSCVQGSGGPKYEIVRWRDRAVRVVV